MSLQLQTRQRLAPRCASAGLALGLIIPAIGFLGCATPQNDAPWRGTIAVTQPPNTAQPPPGAYHAWQSGAAPILPGTMAAASPRFWDGRRDAELGGPTPGPATASTQWPAPPRPNEQIFRFRTLERN
jgi:hypothetical protein